MSQKLLKELSAIAIIGITMAAIFPLINPRLKTDFDRYGAGAIALLTGCILSDIAAKKLFKDEQQ
jgi:hypothetical protein